MIVRQSRIFVDLFKAQLITRLVSFNPDCLQAAFYGRLTKGRAVIVCRLAQFLAVLAPKHIHFGYCIGLASLLLRWV
jgi:hypothetical protein